MACASQNWPQDKSYRGSTTAPSLLLLLIVLHPSLPVLRLLWSSRTTTSSSSSESWRTSTCSWTGSTTRSWSWRTRYRNQPCFPSISPSAEGVEGPIPGVRHSLFSLGWRGRWGPFWGTCFGERLQCCQGRSHGQQHPWDLVSPQSRLLHFLTVNLGFFFSYYLSHYCSSIGLEVSLLSTSFLISKIHSQSGSPTCITVIQCNQRAQI